MKLAVGEGKLIQRKREILFFRRYFHVKKYDFSCENVEIQEESQKDSHFSVDASSYILHLSRNC